MHKQSSEYVFSSSKLKFQELLSFLQLLEPLKSSMLICLKESDLPSQVFLVAESKGFKFDLELKEMIQNMFSAVGQTTIDENGFKVQRMAESSSSNRAMSNQRRWSSLITSGVATDPFRFRELPDFRDEVIPPGFSQRDMGSMYNSTMKNCSPEIRGVTGENRTPSWYSPAPRNESAVDADLDLACQVGDMGLAWLGGLHPAAFEGGLARLRELDWPCMPFWCPFLNWIRSDHMDA
jgi:hypothetical protein